MTGNICWHDIRPDWRHFRECLEQRDLSIYWGRCRSGKRWFWVTSKLGRTDDEDDRRHGWADTEQVATADARAAVVELAAGHPAMASPKHGMATRRLREINAAKRKTRPASGDSTTGTVEYLYGVHHHVSDDSRYPDEWKIVSFQITKKTPKRIYYVRSRGYFADEEPEIGYVDRWQLEENGEVSTHRGWWEDDCILHAEPPDLSHRQSPTPEGQRAELSRLKHEMADAHPDRGGTDESFIEARRRYVQAQRKVRSTA